MGRVTSKRKPDFSKDAQLKNLCLIMWTGSLNSSAACLVRFFSLLSRQNEGKKHMERRERRKQGMAKYGEQGKKVTFSLPEQCFGAGAAC